MRLPSEGSSVSNLRVAVGIFLFTVRSIAALRPNVFGSGCRSFLRRRQGDRNFWLATYYCLDSESIKLGVDWLKVVSSL